MLCMVIVLRGAAPGDTVVISDYLNSALHKVSEDGKDLGKIKIPYPFSMTSDRFGNIYTTGFPRNKSSSPLNKVSPSGRILKNFKYKNETYLDLYAPTAADNHGNLFVANGGYGTLENFSSAGEHIGKVSFTGVGNSTGMTSDRQGNLYVASTVSINKFGPGGMDQGVILHGVIQIRHMACDGNGNLYIVGSHGRIYKYSSSGVGFGVFAEPVASPAGICFDSKDNLFCISHAGLLQKYNKNGILLKSTFIPGVAMPSGIAVISSFEKYYGNFTAVTDDETGGIQFTFTKSGSFTGKHIKTGQATRSFKGVLDQNISFSDNIPKTLVSLAFQIRELDSTYGSIACYGNVGGSSFMAFPSRHVKGISLQETGQYTQIIGIEDAGPGSPQGYGYSLFSVSATGIVKMSGKLADGTTLTCSGPVTGRLGDTGSQFSLINNSLYGAKGSVCGRIYFGPYHDSDFVGYMAWSKPVTKPPLESAHNTRIPTWGSRFRKAGRNESIFPNPQFVLNIGGGRLQDVIEVQGAISSPAKTAIFGDNPQKVKIVVAGNGLVSGTFLHSITGKPVKFQGVVYQNENFPWIAGYFISPVIDKVSVIGWVSLTPQ